MDGPGPASSPDSLAPLTSALRAAVHDAVEGVDRASLLFSGGLDSSLIAWLVPARVALDLVVIGVEDAPDVAAASSAAALLGRTVRTVTVDRNRVSAGLDRWSPEIEMLREPARSVALAFALATEAAPAGRVLCGQGADELFYGYAHFRGRPPEEARELSRLDLERLEGQDWPRAQRIAVSLGRELRAPFLEGRVRGAAAAFSPPGVSQPPKVWLRHAAEALGLPRTLVERRKRALQYGSGIARIVRGLSPPGTGRSE